MLVRGRIRLDARALRPIANEEKVDARMIAQRLHRIEQIIEVVRESGVADVRDDELPFEPELAHERVLGAWRGRDLVAIDPHRHDCTLAMATPSSPSR